MPKEINLIDMEAEPVVKEKQYDPDDLTRGSWKLSKPRKRDGGLTGSSGAISSGSLKRASLLPQSPSPSKSFSISPGKRSI